MGTLFEDRSRMLHLPWGDEEISLHLPESWEIAGICEPAASKAVEDPSTEARRSVANPIGSPHIDRLAGPGSRVAVVIDDGSRPTPVARILPVVVEALQRAGVARGDITIVTALGVHRPMEEAEVRSRIGEACGDLRWENHDCDDHTRLTYLGVTSWGTRVLVNSTVADADLIVSIGCIEPHLIASFGGGYKNLIPGVAARETIAVNHGLNCTAATYNMVGRPIDQNPMRLDLEEAGRMFSCPVFIVNAVLNGALEVVRVVSGSPLEAHRAGVEVSRSIYGVPCATPDGKPIDVVITDSHPMDQDLRQGSKSLANTIQAVRRGGVQIVLMRAKEGVGVFGLADRHVPISRSLLRWLAPLLIRLLPRLKLSGIADDERLFLYFALQAMRHCRIIICAPSIPEEKGGSFPFAEIVASPEEAIARAEALVDRSRRHGHTVWVMVFPHGGSTYATP